MPLSVHLSGPSNTLGMQVMQACAAQAGGTPLGTVGSAVYTMLLSISPPKNMKVDIDGDNDDLTVNVHPL